MIEKVRRCNFCQVIKRQPEHVLFVAYSVEILVLEDYLYEQKPKGKLLKCQTYAVAVAVEALITCTCP